MKRFVISDTHFGHTATWAKFMRKDGSKLRPFTSTEEMDQFMIDQWNSVVGPNDIVYHLGDVAMNKVGLQKVRALKGRKKLIMGNHEHASNQDYYDVGFEELLGIKVIKDLGVLTHVPVHPGSLDRWGLNIHGHTHDSFVTDKFGNPDPRYFCASVEQTGYAPVPFEDIPKFRS